MTERCVRPACTAACASPGTRRRGPLGRAGRAVLLAIAVCCGTALVVLMSTIPGFGRVRRALWAQGRACTWVRRALGVRVRIVGAPRSGPSLVVGNHISFLDILVLSGVAPMRMVAKAEVRSWPLIGGLARRCGALFLDRDRPRRLPETVREMAAALRSGYRVQVFPEGTTRCGDALAVFRRASFQAALDAAVVVSPVAIGYADEQGRCTAPAFLGEETLLDCLRRVLATRGLSATVSWLPAIPAIAGTGLAAADRRSVARLAQNAVARLLGIPVVWPAAGGEPVAAWPSIGTSRNQPESVRIDLTRIEGRAAAW